MDSKKKSELSNLAEEYGVFGHYSRLPANLALMFSEGSRLKIAEHHLLKTLDYKILVAAKNRTTKIQFGIDDKTVRPNVILGDFKARGYSVNIIETPVGDETMKIYEVSWELKF